MYLRYWNQELKSMSKQQPINEGPEWGAESASTYKAVTPGQENADQVPKTEVTPTPDEIQKLVNIVAKRIMGLKESVIRYGTDWNNISKFIDLFDEKGIDYLVQMCEEMNSRGKPLRKLFEDVNPDEFMGEEAVDEDTQDELKTKARKAKSYAIGHEKKSVNAFDRGDDHEMEKHEVQHDKQQKKYHSTLDKFRKQRNVDNVRKIK